ncbi:cysteine protease ATG4A isoform X1 [Denticeps clupeoides]|uniref:cysteine protease ATG4A isoform X1 n=1 Tax=Denticeps clupeoides TaxID=299321 RepID=UPI0010A3565D|nr:cysteine protease ATG4A isoform X1 [Denticeps clupeoides]
MEAGYCLVLAKYENQINVFSDFLDELPDSAEPVWILGQCYDVKTEKSNLLSDISSRLWFTYRKKFSPIGGTGPSSDAGWGCMLRCGQMILAQALVCQHLGREWRWHPESKHPAEYHRILNCFLDKKDSCYSIHQMAQMGVGEGKSVGEWYGPNTVAQVLKKLAVFDDWNSLAVYVSMDNTVVIEDIKKQCQKAGPDSRPCAGACGWGEFSGVSSSSPFRPLSHAHSYISPSWRPLLLLVPLRLGINNINPVYIQALKECFKIPQSCGVLGGKPNLAYYFIGLIGEELIYLDPHTTQSALDAEQGSYVDDLGYHCQRSPHRMKITSLDPSVALGFFCKTEEDFDSWCDLVQKVGLLLRLRCDLQLMFFIFNIFQSTLKEVLKKRNLRMFELVEKHPSHWPPFVPPTKPEVQTTGAEFIESTDKLFESEEEFEILNV